MAITAPDLIQPLGRIAPDLIPRTPDEVEAYDVDPDGSEGTVYATDTAKTAAYVEAFLAGTPEDANTDAKAELYARWRAYEARADAMVLWPASGSAEGEGSYTFTADQRAAARALADRLGAEYTASLTPAPVTPLARRSVVLQPVVRW